MGRASIERPRLLAAKLRAIREAAGLSQNELIKVLGFEGITQAEISAFELGKRLPPLLILLRYAQFAQTHVDNLIDDEESLLTRVPPSSGPRFR